MTGPTTPNHVWEPEPIQVTLVRRLDDLDGKIRSLEDWRLEMKTVWRVVQLTLGTSVVAAIIGAINLWTVLVGSR